MGQLLQSFAYFVLAGFCEIAGGYFVWIWLRDDKAVGWAFLGGLLLLLYGVIPTLQPAHFGRVYPAYGGVFIVMALLWGWAIDGIEPDRFDMIGAGIALVGILIIMYWPRG